MAENDVEQPAEDRLGSEREAQRSLGALAAQALDNIATGAEYTTGGLIVTGAVAKAKDVLTPKDEGPKIELPPGVEK